jgi:RHS repeat-associated protein
MNQRNYIGLAALVIAAAISNAGHAAVGRTQGAFNVTPTGAATYTIPIFTPPGPRGMQPSIALSYNSNGGIGPVGKGWGIAGLSSISRCDKTFAQDGVPAAVALATSDAYCMNGNRMRLTGGTYGSAGSTYQTEIADFSLVTAVGAQGNGPASFTVQGKDGLIYEYGNTGDSRIIAGGSGTASVWMLNLIKDRFNNRVKFTYATPDATLTGTTNPIKIEWAATSAGATTFLYSMDFNYGDNVLPSTVEGFVAGTEVKNQDLLNFISVSHNGGVVRKYVLGYQTSPTTGVKRLEAVKECSDAAETDCFQLPTVIAYQDGAVGTETTPTATVPGPMANMRARYDFNGDGFMDLFYKANGTWSVAFGSTAGFGAAQATGIVPQSNTLGIEAIVSGDFRGNGKDSILASVGGTWIEFSWNDSSFVSASTGLATDLSALDIMATDVTGDGRLDLISINGTYVVNTYANTGTTSAVSFAAPIGFTGLNSTNIISARMFSPDAQGRNIKFYDFNGDGRHDLVVQMAVCAPGPIPNCVAIGYGMFKLVAKSGLQYDVEIVGTTTSVQLGLITFFADINNDSCTDFVGNGKVYVSGCQGAGPATFNTGGTVVGAADWNSDGRTDLLLAASGATTLSVQLSTGVGLGSVTATGVPHSSACSVLTLDVEGTGADALGCFTTSGLTYYRHNSPTVEPDLATTFTDGLGVVQSVTYGPATWGSHTKQSDAVFPNADYQGPMQIVKTATLPDGVGGTYPNTHTYSGAAMNLQGRGFAGFASHRTVDGRNGVVSDEFFNRDFPRTGTLNRLDLSQSVGGLLISTQTTEFVGAPLDSTQYNERHFVKPTTGVASQYEVGGLLNGTMITQSSQSYVFDGSGNQTDATTTVTDKHTESPTFNQSWTVTSSTPIYADVGPNWCLGLPTSSSTTYSTTTGETSVTRSKSYQPDYVNCRITQEITEPASSNRRIVETITAFDGFGNPSSRSVVGRSAAGADLPARTSSVEFGATGQFPVSTTNPLNQTTGRSFHPVFGSLASETDPNGITVVSNQYDSFGRLQRAIRPDGTSTYVTYNLCTTYGCQNGDPASGATSINKTIVIASDRNTADGQIRDEWTYLDLFDRPIVQRSRNLAGGYSRTGRQYDVLGRLYRETVPCDEASCAPYWVTNAYDLINRVSSQTRPQSQSVSTPVTTTFQYAGRTQTATDPQGKITTKVLDPMGLLRRSQDHNGYYQTFGYDALGSLKSVNDSLGNALFSANVSYSAIAIQDSTNDMDLGARTLNHTSFGELTSWTDAKGQNFSQTFDALSRLTLRQDAEENGTTTWIWGTSAAAKNIGSLTNVFTHGSNYTFSYDSIGRPAQRTFVIDQTYTFQYDYHADTGLPRDVIYPMSTAGYQLRTRNNYQYGMLQQVVDANTSSPFWTANAQNQRGQVTQETLGNGVVTNRAIDAVTGWVSTIQSGVGGGAALQNESYLRDLVGNVTQRQNNNAGLSENFYYDNLYRLDYSQLTVAGNTTTNLDLGYDAMGNITSRSDIAGGAAWTYHPTKKHAVIQAGSGSYTYAYDANGNATSRFGQTVTWSSYNYPTLITGPGKTLGFFYDANRNRYRQFYTSSTGTESTYYAGGLLEKVVNSTGTDWRHYVNVGGQVVAVVSRHSNGTNLTRYMLEDQQGSPSNILNANGTSFVQEAFSAFGQRRDAATWQDSCLCDDLSKIKSVSRRGYTGHEAIGGVSMGLNHMNGRVQDAITGRFLSADPYIPNLGNTQSFNRYGYVMNNPMSAVDPTGFTDCLYDCVDKIPEVVVTGNRLPPGLPANLDFSVPIMIGQSMLMTQPPFLTYQVPGSSSPAKTDEDELEEVTVTGKRLPKPKVTKSLETCVAVSNVVANTAGGAVGGYIGSGFSPIGALAGGAGGLIEGVLGEAFGFDGGGLGGGAAGAIAGAWESHISRQGASGALTGAVNGAFGVGAGSASSGVSSALSGPSRTGGFTAGTRGHRAFNNAFARGFVGAFGALVGGAVSYGLQIGGDYLCRKAYGT